MFPPQYSRLFEIAGMPADWACSGAQLKGERKEKRGSWCFQLQTGRLVVSTPSSCNEKQQTAAHEAETWGALQCCSLTPDQNACFPSHLTGTITPNKKNTGHFPGRNTGKCWVELTTLYLHIKWRMNRAFSRHFNGDKDFSLTSSLSGLCLWLAFLFHPSFHSFSHGSTVTQHISFMHTHTRAHTNTLHSSFGSENRSLQSFWVWLILCKSGLQPVLTLLKFGLFASSS